MKLPAKHSCEAQMMAYNHGVKEERGYILLLRWRDGCQCRPNPDKGVGSPQWQPVFLHKELPDSTSKTHARRWCWGRRWGSQLEQKHRLSQLKFLSQRTGEGRLPMRIAPSHSASGTHSQAAAPRGPGNPQCSLHLQTWGHTCNAHDELGQLRLMQHQIVLTTQHSWDNSRLIQAYQCTSEPCLQSFHLSSPPPPSQQAENFCWFSYHLAQGLIP